MADRIINESDEIGIFCSLLLQNSELERIIQLITKNILPL